MKRIHIKKAEFERVLALGSQCVVPSRALPLSGYIRISVKGDKLKVEAFNALSSIRVYGTLDMETEECSFCVDCKDSKLGAPVFNRIVSLKSSFVLPKK